MGTETAKDQLDLDDQLGDYVQGNVDPNISAVNRTQTEFGNQRIDNPSGGTGDIIHPIVDWSQRE